MAFTVKLTDLLKEACDVARADGASLYAFILKNDGHDAASFGVQQDVPQMFCALASLVEEACEATGMSRKQLFKVLDKSLNEAPIKKGKLDE